MGRAQRHPSLHSKNILQRVERSDTHHRWNEARSLDPSQIRVPSTMMGVAALDPSYEGYEGCEGSAAQCGVDSGSAAWQETQRIDRLAQHADLEVQLHLVRVGIAGNCSSGDSRPGT